jgi:hypothetical protein
VIGSELQPEHVQIKTDRGAVKQVDAGLAVRDRQRGTERPGDLAGRFKGDNIVVPVDAPKSAATSTS